MSAYYDQESQVLENGFLRLEYLTQAGPRLVRLSLAGSSENILAELPNLQVPTVWGRYRFLGGHRLWHSPEAMPRTYVPDDTGLQVEQLADGVRLFRAPEEPTGIAKSITIRLAADRPALTLEHTLSNHGLWPVQMAPWAITQLAPGGLAVLPLPEGNADPAGLLPNCSLAIWPYTRLDDPRLGLHQTCIVFKTLPPGPAFKIGYFNTHGWIGYYRSGVLFRKTFPVRAGKVHPDFNCNAEMYCNNQFIELESLGQLEVVPPGGEVSHSETWEIGRGLENPSLTDAMRALLG